MNKIKIHKLSFKITFFVSFFIISIFLLFNLYLNFLIFNFYILLILFFCFFALYFFIDYLLGPIYKIESYVNGLNVGNAGTLIIESEDELGRLASSIVNLSSNLKKDSIELDYLSNVRTQFIANVSHELKTPIFAIKGFVETLINGAILDNDVNIKFLKKISHQSNRLENLFSDLITISKIESKELSLSPEKFKLNDIMVWLDETFSEETKKKGIELLIPSLGKLEVYGDKGLLQSVFENLVKNAINHTSKGKVTIIIKKFNKNIKVKIIDNGVGISEKYHDRVFERFFRVDDARSRDLGGTGLGLSIVKHILEAHKTTINLKSELGRGSEFSFYLPIS